MEPQALVDAIKTCEIRSIDSYRSTPNVNQNDDRVRVVLTFELRRNRGLKDFFSNLMKKVK